MYTTVAAEIDPGSMYVAQDEALGAGPLDVERRTEANGTRHVWECRIEAAAGELLPDGLHCTDAITPLANHEGVCARRVGHENRVCTLRFLHDLTNQINNLRRRYSIRTIPYRKLEGTCHGLLCLLDELEALEDSPKLPPVVAPVAAFRFPGSLIAR